MSAEEQVSVIGRIALEHAERRKELARVKSEIDSLLAILGSLNSALLLDPSRASGILGESAAQQYLNWEEVDRLVNNFISLKDSVEDGNAKLRSLGITS